MKKSLLTFCGYLLSHFLYAQNPADTLTLRTVVPDSAFRSQLLLKVDLNKDKKLQWSEVLGTHKLSITDSKIRNFAGIEKFANLDTLVIFLSLTTLDLSQNEKMIYLEAHNQKPLSSILVSKKAPYIVIDAHDNALTSFDASGLSQLKYLKLGAQKITSLNIKGTSLTYLNAFENPKMQVCVDSKEQWDAIPDNDLRKCAENPQNTWCTYELTCILTTALNESAHQEENGQPYIDYDLMGQELTFPSRNQVMIRRYANGKSEKRFVTE